MASMKLLNSWKKSVVCVGGSKCCSGGLSKKAATRGIRRTSKRSWKKDQEN